MSDFFILNNSRSSGVKPRHHSTAPNASRIAGIPTESSSHSGSRIASWPATAAAAAAHTSSQRQPDTGAFSRCDSSRDLATAAIASASS
ncbi:MAG TPA: hypothetical protein VFS45_04525, partial [Sphingomicrobium sp.]|nr:hypothetical protein [Sphingomicrobium sp.]